MLSRSARPLLIVGAALLAAGTIVLFRQEAPSRPRVDLDLLPPRPSLPVDIDALHRLISVSDRIVITDGPDSTVMFSSTLAQDVRSFDQALDVAAPARWTHDMCEGSPAIHIYRGDKEIVLITYHHGTAIRTSLWDSDAPLRSNVLLLKWFDDRGIGGPRSEMEFQRRRAEEHSMNASRWVSAIPSPLKPFQSVLLEGDYPPRSLDRRELHRALEQGVPTRREQIRLLYHWFGSGAGPWTGFPSYEGCAEELLLHFDTSDLIAVASRSDLDPTELEGAARLFAGWTFHQQRPNDRARLPPSLRATLLKHSLQDPNEDKQARARNAFEKPE